MADTLGPGAGIVEAIDGMSFAEFGTCLNFTTFDISNASIDVGSVGTSIGADVGSAISAGISAIISAITPE